MLAGTGLSVQERICDVDSVIHTNQLRHVIALSGVHMDMMERIFMARFLGANAELACGFCEFQSTSTGPNGSIYRPMGYSEPALQDLLYDPPKHLYANHQDLIVSER
jgi:hypothetical protein